MNNSVFALPVAEIRRREDARPLNEEALAELADSIRDLGLINPITVRKIAGEGYEVIAGNHRLAAVDLNGEPEILCVIVDDDDLTAELRMIDENLMRAELSTAERAKALSRRKAIYEELHPASKAGTVSANARWHTDANSAPAFTTSAAAVTGRSGRVHQPDRRSPHRYSPRPARRPEAQQLRGGRRHAVSDRREDPQQGLRGEAWPDRFRGVPMRADLLKLRDIFVSQAGGLKLTLKDTAEVLGTSEHQVRAARQRIRQRYERDEAERRATAEKALVAKRQEALEQAQQQLSDRQRARREDAQLAEIYDRFSTDQQHKGASV